MFVYYIIIHNLKIEKWELPVKKFKKAFEVSIILLIIAFNYASTFYLTLQSIFTEWFIAQYQQNHCNII